MNGQNIRTLRKQLKLSQQDFADKLGVSRNTIWYWESGQKTPGEDSLRQLAELAKSISNSNQAVSKNDVSVSKSDETVSKIESAVSNIPNEMKEYPHWICWGVEERNGNATKVPYSPHGGKASVDDPSTWGTIEQAQTHLGRNEKLSGIGFVFAENDPFCGIDLDKCRDTETGEIDSDA